MMIVDQSHKHTTNIMLHGDPVNHHLSLQSMELIYGQSTQRTT